MNNALMFSKASDEWSTPIECYASLNAEFGFLFDAAAVRENAKCYDWFGPDAVNPAWRDALTFPTWRHLSRGPFWLNPPYSFPAVGQFADYEYQSTVHRLAG